MDERAVSRRELHPDGRVFRRRQGLDEWGRRERGHDHALFVDAVVGHLESGDGAHPVANLRLGDARTNGLDCAHRLITQPRGQRGRVEVLPLAVEALGVVETDGLDPEVDFTLPGLRHRRVLELKYLRPAHAVEADGLISRNHVISPLVSIQSSSLLELRCARGGRRDLWFGVWGVSREGKSSFQVTRSMWIIWNELSPTHLANALNTIRRTPSGPRA